ncbi:predicted protein [Naegleria gruberi]|uniref:Predicted protein n=1 Tax=Naegleria gruberi TaxID=5762 RepID=D2VPX5_NAEGR|nr:uncharacterized protein NAEGRDRAFT_71020 [Naegleria gruberi]EFC41283.1 predicted protein [Naegleria gruberi]|eukprot:XP_002674027.1 predicted protein [Naegleria gruberi strain NEG-M]
MTRRINSLVKYWKSILQTSERKKWVMFNNGSVVIFIDRDETLNNSLIQDAKEIMQRDGIVIPGTPHGDFNVIEIDTPEPGCVVTGHNPNLLVVSLDSLEDWSERSLPAVLMLRMRRHLDAQELDVVACSEDDLIQ